MSSSPLETDVTDGKVSADPILHSLSLHVSSAGNHQLELVFIERLKRCALGVGCFSGRFGSLVGGRHRQVLADEVQRIERSFESRRVSSGLEEGLRKVIRGLYSSVT